MYTIVPCSPSGSGYRSGGPPQEVVFEGKTFQLQLATNLDTYESTDGEEPRAQVFEYPADFFTGIKGSRMEEKVRIGSDFKRAQKC